MGRKRLNPDNRASPDYPNLQGQNFQCILYPDATNYNCDFIINHILPDSGFFQSWFYILHDSDLNDDGCIKKAHYHVIVTKTSPSKIGIVSKQLGVPVTDVERCRSLKDCINYLDHNEILDKHQYSKDEIITNDHALLNKCFSVDSDAEAGKLIIEFILNNHIASVSQLSCWVLENGLYSAYRRGFAIFARLIAEQRD